MNPAWFDCLCIARTRAHYAWLGNLPSPVNAIANFGCWSGAEPFALMWTLNARELVVLEIEEKYLITLANEIERIKRMQPGSLVDREIHMLCRNMCVRIRDLPDSAFDLAFCENVLYTLPLQEQNADVAAAIHQMTRVVKPGGFVIAVEPKFGAIFETRHFDLAGIPIAIPIPVGEPKDMSAWFASDSLVRIQVADAPHHAYCFQKTNQ
ncbi:MAG: methyltransferase domain-containing protein [Anaerolineales bacterium]|nr:methyltransferase domain-containing protein [Anaerolineales bacterium]